MGNFLNIMIPAFGQSPYLQATIDSVLSNQLLDDCSITVVDDCSPSSNIQEVTSHYGSLVKYVRNDTNLGIGGNFKRCHDISDSKLVIILGSDDRLLPNAVSRLRVMHSEFPESAFYHLGTEVIDKNGKLITSLTDTAKKIIAPKFKGVQTLNGNQMSLRLSIGNFTYFPAIAWNNSYRNNFNWATQYDLAVDLELLFNLSRSDFAFTFDDETSFQYRRHNLNSSKVFYETGQRIREEIDLHSKLFHSMPWTNNFQLKISLLLAPTIRFNALLNALKLLFKSPKISIQLALNALKF